jgi:sugar phosphate isomerase/epimerase
VGVAAEFWTGIDALARARGFRVAIEMHPHNLVFSPVTLRKLVDLTGATSLGAEMDPSRLMWQGMDVVASIRWLGPLVFPAAAEGKVPTGYGYWCNAWPPDPAWRFVAVGVGHDVPYWTEFLRALAGIDPDMAVNIEHEDASYSRLDGLSLAAGNLRTAAAKL